MRYCFVLEQPSAENVCAGCTNLRGNVRRFIWFVDGIGISSTQFDLVSLWHAAMISGEQAAAQVSKVRFNTNFGDARMMR